jgi:hypothetical protein
MFAGLRTTEEHTTITFIMFAEPVEHILATVISVAELRGA